MCQTLDENASRTEALNIDGAFFPKGCADEFRRGARWQVISEEHPVFFPREGPMGQRLESAADMIVAAASGWSGGPRGYLCVECKKADPRFREWIFFRKFGQHHRFRNLALYRKGSNERPAQVLVEGDQVNLCDYGRELAVGHKGKSHSTNPASNRIQDAARQAVLAVRSFCDELHGIADQTLTTLKTLTPLEWLWQDQRLDFVPVVITTAKLLVCEFQVAKVDLASGSLTPGSGGFEERPWIVYDYPTTSGLGFGPDDVEPIKGGANPLEVLTKIHVLFLQSSALKDLAKTNSPIPQLVNGW